VKEEDADWVIYHLIVQEPSLSVEGLITASGLDPGVVDASLKRLEQYLLIERTEGNVRALTLGEALIRCQIKYSKDLPYIIEDGVIKERKT
jgi:DNA-binding MarR family transcriptional regulator